MTLHEFEDRKRNVINGQLLNGNLNNNFEFRLFYFEINLKISFFFCSSPIVTQILSVANSAWRTRVCWSATRRRTRLCRYGRSQRSAPSFVIRISRSLSPSSTRPVTWGATPPLIETRSSPRFSTELEVRKMEFWFISKWSFRNYVTLLGRGCKRLSKVRSQDGYGPHNF